MTTSPSFDLNLLVTKWTAILTKPSEAAFEAEKPNVNLNNMIMLVAAVGAIFGFLGGLARLDLGAAIGGLIFGAIFGVIGYLLWQGILYLVARVLGGTGDFATQAYLQSVYWVPLFLVNSVLQIVPILGGILSFLVGLYGLYLSTLALKVTHRYDTTKAILTWAIPAIVLFAIGACLILVGAAAFFAYFNMATPQ